MLLVDLGNKTLRSLDDIRLSDEGLQEKFDLQEWITRSPEEFFSEIGEELFVVGKEVRPIEGLGDSIDILALDKDGRSVVIELKRGKKKRQLLQAISYAAMLARWEPKDFQRHLGENRFVELVDFLDVESEAINREQRLLLVAESYDLEVLMAAQWLSEHYGLNVSCIRVALARDGPKGPLYLTCSTVFPAPELEETALPRATAVHPTPKPTDWEEVLAELRNPDLADFVRAELERGARALIRMRALRYRHGERNRWQIRVRKAEGRGTQGGRFDGDVEYWKRGLSQPDRVEALGEGRYLRFYLKEKADFDFFLGSVTTRLRDVVWLAEDEQPAETASSTDEDA
ncbi:MAG: hypothetical protein FJ279_32625 [Planctomycetes bacterium]|nr:hypothetical protein [Planctomycetota bacterium]